MPTNLPPFPIRETYPTAARLFKGAAQKITDLYPSLEYYLDASGIEEEPQSYVVIGISNAFLLSLFLFFVLNSLSIFAGQFLQFFGFALLGSVFFFIFTLFYWTTYPRVQALKRAQLIDRELVFALRDVSVEMDAGISFVDSLELLTEGYGVLSEEMTQVVKDIRLGTPVEEALEASMQRNASDLYQNAVLRIVNGLRSGADVPTLLSVVIDSLTEEMKVQVKQYGSEMNLWATLYLIIGIVLPSMGLSLIVMLSTFTGLVLTPALIYTLAVLMVLFHGSAILFLRSRRPVIGI